MNKIKQALHKLIIVILSVSGLFFIITFANNELAKGGVLNIANGTMTANGKTYQIKHSYVDEGPEDIIVVLTDNSLTQENIPFGLHQLAMEGKVHGLVFTISKQTKELARGLNAIYDESWGGQLGSLGNPILKIEKFDDQIIEGHIYTSEENKFSEYTYSFDVTFKTSLGMTKEETAIEVSIKGDDSPPAAAYASYYRALMDGDISKVKTLIITEHAEQLDSEKAEMFLDMAKSTRPRDIEIVTKENTDKSAVLNVMGNIDNSQGTGTVNMVVEDGKWKVETDKWKFNN